MEVARPKGLQPEARRAESWDGVLGAPPARGSGGAL